MPEEKLELNVSSDGVGDATQDMNLLANSIGSVNKLMAGLGVTMGGIAIGSFFKDAVNEAVKYEEQIAQIQKVTDRGVAQQMRLEIQDMASEMPVARDEMTQIVEEAGRLGVEGVDNIKNFTRTVSQLSVATNITSRDAAKDFARFASLTQTPIDQIEELGSVVNKLSNNMATSADEIVDSMTRAGGAASQFGIRAENVSAVAASLNEVSASARRSGTRVRRLFQEMQNPGKIEDIAGALNMTVTEFQRLQENSPDELFIKLIERFRNSEEAADKMRETFSSASRTAISGLSQNIEGLQEALGFAKGQMEDATSLTREYGIQAATTASQQQVLQNRIQNLKTEIGEGLQPTYADFLDFLSHTVREWNLIIGRADQVTKSLRNMKRVMQTDVDVENVLDQLTTSVPFQEMGEDFVNAIPGLESKDFLNDRNLRKIRSRLAGNLKFAVRKDAELGKNMVEAFKARAEDIRVGLLETGELNEKEAMRRFDSFFETWSTKITQATEDGFENSTDKAKKNLSESRRRILEGSADFLSRRLSRESSDMANEFENQFEQKFERVRSRIKSGDLGTNEAVEKINSFFDKWRKKIRDEGDSLTDQGETTSQEIIDSLTSNFSANQAFQTLEPYFGEWERLFDKAGREAPDALVESVRSKAQDLGIIDALKEGANFEDLRKEFEDESSRAVIQALSRLEELSADQGGDAGRRWAQQFGQEARQVLEGTVTSGAAQRRADQLQSTAEEIDRTMPDAEDLPGRSGVIGSGGRLREGLQGGREPFINQLENEKQLADDIIERQRILDETEMEPLSQKIVSGRFSSARGISQRLGLQQAQEDMEDFGENSSRVFEDMNRDMESMLINWESSFTNTLSNMVVEGEASFDRLAKSILKDISRITIQRNITRPFLEAGTEQIQNQIDSLWSGGSDSGGSGSGGPGFGSMLSSMGSSLYKGAANAGSYITSFFDTPGVMEAQGGGSVVEFARGDKFAAAQNYGDLQRQVNQGSGGGDQIIKINQTVEISPETEQTVKAQVRNALPELEESVRAAVFDEMNRGGGPSDSVRRAG